MRINLFAALLIFSVAGCYSPDYGDGALQCAADDRCPPGLHCAVDNRCYKAGSGPDLSASMDLGDAHENDLSFDDGGRADMATTLRHQGQACGPGDLCDNGTYCVDGYCCNSLCGNTCQACNVLGNLGVCTNVGAGNAPSGARTCNAQSMSSCGRDGTCDGAGNCRDWPAGTQCAPGTCTVASGSFTNPSTCNGSGTCVANAGGSCAPYVCQDATQCASSCMTQSQCSGTNSCVGGSCGTLPNSRACTTDSQCTSTHCVDGYCCDTACNSASCQACDVPGSFGTCSTVAAGAPHGGRMCTNQGTSPCGGECDGTNAACSYAGNSTACGTTCKTSQLQNSYCNGAGSCAAATPVTCPGNFVCPSGASACLTTCTAANDCYPQASFGCNDSSSQCASYCLFDTTGDNFDNSGCIYAP